MVSGDSPRAEELDEIDKNMETALRACIQDCITVPLRRLDSQCAMPLARFFICWRVCVSLLAHVQKRKGPYEPHEAEKLLRNVETEPPGDRRKAAVRECLHRFMFGGQVVCLKEITGKFQYRNGRVGLIKNDRPDEHGRFIVEVRPCPPTSRLSGHRRRPPIAVRDAAVSPLACGAHERELAR